MQQKTRVGCLTDCAPQPCPQVQHEVGMLSARKREPESKQQHETESDDVYPQEVYSYVKRPVSCLGSPNQGFFLKSLSKYYL